MKELSEFLRKARGAQTIVLSGAREGERFRKITLKRDGTYYNLEQLTQTQAFHKRVTDAELAAYLEEAFKGFAQMAAWNDGCELQLRRGRGESLLYFEHASKSAPKQAEGHDVKRSYIIAEGQLVPPLVDMGVMTQDGRVVKAMYHKYRQINRYLEFIDDTAGKDESPLHIVDFGCGKSYLSFVVYWYFTVLKGRSVSLTGVDLKADALSFCRAAAQKYGYGNMDFVCADIREYHGERPMDMAISLHACDTATDYALMAAVREGARYIFAAPCCQHELAGQLSPAQTPIPGAYGVMRERYAALLTDAIRAELLTCCGYKTQVMEFVDLQDTPKNLLIRASLGNIDSKRKKAALDGVKESMERTGVTPTFFRLLTQSGKLEGI